MCAPDRLPKNKAGASMLGFLTPVRKEATDPLASVATVESFWATLPRDNPIAAQKAVCEALADHLARGSPDNERLRALLLLDTRARALVDALLVNEPTGNDQALADENLPRQAAFELCWSFGRVHGQLARAMSDNRFPGRRKHEPHVLVKLFQQCQLELLLRPFIDERSTRFSWKELHTAYRFAQSRGLLRDVLPIHRNGFSGAVQTTLEREYVHVLMQDFMNGGQFPPDDAFWISRRMAGWCQAMKLGSRTTVESIDSSSTRRATPGLRGRTANRRTRGCASIWPRSSIRCARKSRRFGMPLSSQAKARRRDVRGSSPCSPSSACTARPSGQ